MFGGFSLYFLPSSLIKANNIYPSWLEINYHHYHQPFNFLGIYSTFMCIIVDTLGNGERSNFLPHTHHSRSNTFVMNIVHILYSSLPFRYSCLKQRHKLIIFQQIIVWIISGIIVSLYVWKEIHMSCNATYMDGCYWTSICDSIWS